MKASQAFALRLLKIGERAGQPVDLVDHYRNE
jgi:hypothetical protein